MYIQEGISFENYTFEINVNKYTASKTPITVKPENIFNMAKNTSAENCGIRVEVLDDYSIKVQGICAVDKAFILFNQNGVIITDNGNSLYNTIKEQNTEKIVDNNKYVTFRVDEVIQDDTNISIPVNGNFNVLLRSYSDVSKSSPIVYVDNNTSKELNCKLASDKNIGKGISAEISGTVTNGPVYTLALYITRGTSFTNYIIKPNLVI